MKIVLRNLGPIYRFEIDFDHAVSLLSGENNQGKSYALYVVYLTLKRLLSFDSSLYLEHHFLQDLNLEDAKENENLTPVYETALQNFLDKTLTEGLSQSIQNAFGEEKVVFNRFSGELFEIEICAEVFSATFIYQNQRFVCHKLKLNSAVFCAVDEDGKSCYFAAQPSERFAPGYLCILALESFFEELHSKVTQVYFLPCSRSGLYQAFVAFIAIFEEFANDPRFLRKRVNLPGVSEPMADYFRNLYHLTAEPDPHPSAAVAAEIEREILKGYIQFDEAKRKLFYYPNHSELAIDLSAASSIVLELAPIVAHLKYKIAKPELALDLDVDWLSPHYILFIEEPEAHLSESLVQKLAELLLRLASKEVKMILTTHSSALAQAFVEKSKTQPEVQTIELRRTEKGSVSEQLKA